MKYFIFIEIQRLVFMKFGKDGRHETESEWRLWISTTNKLEWHQGNDIVRQMSTAMWTFSFVLNMNLKGFIAT